MLAGVRVLQLGVLVGVPALIWFLWWLRTANHTANTVVLGTPMATGTGAAAGRHARVRALADEKAAKVVWAAWLTDSLMRS